MVKMSADLSCLSLYIMGPSNVCPKGTHYTQDSKKYSLYSCAYFLNFCVYTQIKKYTQESKEYSLNSCI